MSDNVWGWCQDESSGEVRKSIAAILIFAGVYIVTQSKSRTQMEREKATSVNQ
jgi:hypothetical protein